MKCDELKAKRIAPDGPRDIYVKSEVDEAIAELKARIRELENMPHTDNSAVIELLERTVLELKGNIAQLEDDNALLRKNNAELREATRWRKVSEELPEEYTDILFVDSDGTYYLGDMWFITNNHAEQYWSGRGEPRCENPKYWMPKPKAPEDV